MSQQKVSTTRATAEGIEEVLEIFKKSFTESREQNVCNDVKVVATFTIPVDC